MIIYTEWYNFNYYFLYSKVPAFLHVTDIAGLVQGAHEGQGLGNAFLSHIRACDALFHMSSKYDSRDVALRLCRGGGGWNTSIML